MFEAHMSLGSDASSRIRDVLVDVSEQSPQMKTLHQLSVDQNEAFRVNSHNTFRVLSV